MEIRPTSEAGGGGATAARKELSLAGREVAMAHQDSGERSDDACRADDSAQGQLPFRASATGGGRPSETGSAGDSSAVNSAELHPRSFQLQRSGSTDSLASVVRQARNPLSGMPALEGPNSASCM